jgi:hypothetical protein
LVQLKFKDIFLGIAKMIVLYRIEICENLQLLKEISRDAKSKAELIEWVQEYISTHSSFKNLKLQIRITPENQITKLYFNYEQ